MAERTNEPLKALHWYTHTMAFPEARPSRWFFLGRVAAKTQQHTMAAAAYKRYLADRKTKGLPSFRHDGGLLDWEQALVYGALDRPAYAHGLFRAALLASQLGIAAISVLELGVAGGRGLLALQDHAIVVTELTGVELSIHGFDTGHGLPAPQDYRDVPHFFRQGSYAMQQDVLVPRLNNAALHLGDAPVIFKQWLREPHEPIAAMFFDMDHYTPTAKILKQMGDRSSHEHFLPRVATYFDDVVPKRPNEWLKDYSDSTGERLAIREFNNRNKHTRVSPDYIFAAARVRAPWHDCWHTLHRHRHPLYSAPIAELKPDSLGIT